MKKSKIQTYNITVIESYTNYDLLANFLGKFEVTFEDLSNEHIENISCQLHKESNNE